MDGTVTLLEASLSESQAKQSATTKRLRGIESQLAKTSRKIGKYKEALAAAEEKAYSIIAELKQRLAEAPSGLAESKM